MNNRCGKQYSLMPWFELVVKVILTFALVFNISFIFSPSLSTGRIALILMILMYGKNAFIPFAIFMRTYKQSFVLFIFLIGYSLFLVSLNNFEDSILFSRMLWFFCFSIIAAFLYMQMCNYSLSKALTYYLLAMLMQSFFVFYSIIQPDFRLWINETLVNSGNIDFGTEVRFSGFSNGGGSNLSLQLSIGSIAALCLFAQYEKPWVKINMIFSTIIITIATIFVGRTGLYICLLTCVSFFCISKQGLRIVSSVCITALIIFFLVPHMNFIAQIDSLYNLKLERTLEWAFDFLFTGQSSTANALISNLSETKSLNLTDFIFGSGRITTPDGTNYSQHDSGYLHSLYAMGFPLSLLFYLALSWIFFDNLKIVTGKLKIIGLGIVALVFLAECKEPYIFKYTLPFFTFIYIYLAKIDALNTIKTREVTL